MKIISMLHFAAAIFTMVLAGYGLYREPRSFVHRIFTLGMTVLAVETLFTGLSGYASLPEKVLLWQNWRFRTETLLPVVWLIFSLGMAQADFKITNKKWNWLVLATFLLHLSFVSLFSSKFFQGMPFSDPSHGWLTRLGWSGKAFHICFLLSIVTILVLLEKTLRASKGLKRRRIKFFLIGVGSIFSARVYTVSQILLFNFVSLELEAINVGVLIVGNILIFVAMLRAPTLDIDIYPSQTALYSSVTIVCVGVYLLIVGILARIASSLNSLVSFPLHSLFVFLALIFLLMVLFSERVQQGTKKFISYHFRRPQYDYRSAWLSFAQRTASRIELQPLCNEVCKILSEMLNFPTVSIWVLNETETSLKLGGSTGLSRGESVKLPELQKCIPDFMQLMRASRAIVDLESANTAYTTEFNHLHSEFLRQADIRYSMPLVTNGDFLGVITLGHRSGGDHLTIEEEDLLRSIANQTSATLLNFKFAERLGQVKEMEAFQTVAAFFVHDLKNMAAKLSMVLQNMPVHFDDPLFRKDALRLVSQSVTKINDLCSRISSVRTRLELRPVKADLNEVVRNALGSLDTYFNETVREELNPVPKVLFDPEQIQKVIINLILNAKDAISDKGEINVITAVQDGSIQLTVRDNGRGMPPQFLEQDLFRPFKTTKKQGMGIGLFHSKLIVEEHKGRIEVESEEGVGSTFRVRLPIDSKST